MIKDGENIKFSYAQLEGGMIKDGENNVEVIKFNWMNWTNFGAQCRSVECLCLGAQPARNVDLEILEGSGDLGRSGHSL